MSIRTEHVEVGARVAYEDAQNPRREGKVLAIVEDGRQFAVAWDASFQFPAVGGDDPVTGCFSDLNQAGWHVLADMPGSIFDGAEIISSYTRTDAIRDGALVPMADLVPDEPDFARHAGFLCDVCLTSSVAAIVRPTERESGECLQDVKGRLWDVLNMARMYGRGIASRESWEFPCIFWLAGPERAAWTKAKRQKTLALKVVLGIGDDGEPVATIMFRAES